MSIKKCSYGSKQFLKINFKVMHTVFKLTDMLKTCVLSEDLNVSTDWQVLLLVAREFQRIASKVTRFPQKIKKKKSKNVALQNISDFKLATCAHVLSILDFYHSSHIVAIRFHWLLLILSLLLFAKQLLQQQTNHSCCFDTIGRVFKLKKSSRRKL